MSSSDELYDLLFELSNEYRHSILLQLKEKAMRITDIAKSTDITNPEARRHISRLVGTGLINRDVEGYYHITPYGETFLLFFRELEFLLVNREYFLSHTLLEIPVEFIKRIGELSVSTSIMNPLAFFRQIENLLKESNEYVWMMVDQLPLICLSSIVKAIDRGVKFRIIETTERTLNPDIYSMTSEETQGLMRTKYTPLVDQRMVMNVTAYVIVSETNCLVSFPDPVGKYDYYGFIATDNSSRNWCNELFHYYWREAEPRTPSQTPDLERGRISEKFEPSGSVLINGKDDPHVDAQTVQDAVDNYREVVLAGTFNFGTKNVQISRSVVIRGERRENDVPTTSIYKKGWNFPFAEFDSVFIVDGEDIEVSIENIHFTDFNHSCIWGVKCDKLNVKDNRITLMSGYGRGMTYGAFGDIIIGIWINSRSSEYSLFEGSVNIDDNFIDFARGGAYGGFLTRGGLEENPEYRPDLFNHEYFMSFGVAVHQASGEVIISNNNIRNTNARAIAVTDCLPPARTQIDGNSILSDVYGSYPFSSYEAGAGILVQSAWGYPSPGFKVEVTNNSIKMQKLNYSGIVVLGPVITRKGVKKLQGGVIRKNIAQLLNGYEGIHIRKCDYFDVYNNRILGEAYYGIRISGRNKSDELDLRSLNNSIESNNMDELKISEPNQYSNNHADGRVFAGKEGKSFTSHIWIDKYSHNNNVKMNRNETIIDEGENNKIEYTIKN